VAFITMICKDTDTDTYKTTALLPIAFINMNCINWKESGCYICICICIFTDHGYKCHWKESGCYICICICISTDRCYKCHWKESDCYIPSSGIYNSEL
jgi:hypothetical protein